MHGDPIFLAKIPGIGSYLASTATHHLDHHKYVNIDMTLSASQTTEVYFPWSMTLLLIVILILTLWKIVPAPVLIAIVLVGIHNLLWNNWHTRFHDYQKDVTIDKGLPKLNGFPTGFIYDYLWTYHTIHHSQKGEKTNFNIIFPLFDHLFGTLGDPSCIDNTDYCRRNLSDDRCYQRQTYCYTDKDVIH
jgi:sterol desaturase/sphingolipid hydroxylase (fatty acid hydroxylase superfamily)